MGLHGLLYWSRQAEQSADRVGVLAIGNSDAGRSALVRLVLGISYYAQPELDVSAFVDQKAAIEADAFLLRRLPVLVREATSTHPFPATRAAALAEFRDSALYAQIRARRQKTQSCSST